MKTNLTSIVIGALCVNCFAAGAFGANLIVNNVPFIPSCPGQYSTIQAAVNAANNGDSVIVCSSGTPYNEQVVIANKTVSLKGQSGATIQPTPMISNANKLSSGAPIAAAVLIQNATGVNISNLILDGLNNGLSDCTGDPVGIYYQNASGTAAFNAIRNFKLSAGLEGCQSGLGIYVEAGASGISKVTAQANSVHDFQKNGITANGTGASLTAAQNVVTGWGPTPFIAQNGIQIGFGGTGTINGNVVTNVVYSPCASTASCSDSSTGILIYQANGVNISQNTVNTTQGGIYYFSASGGNANNNGISNTLVWDGIAVADDGIVLGNNHSFDKNVVINSGESGFFIATSNNALTNSSITETPIGIWFNSGSGNTQTGSRFFAVPMPVKTGAMAVQKHGTPKPVD